MVSFNLKVLAKFGLCSNCSQKLDECSLARARKNFATARMLRFSLKVSYGNSKRTDHDLMCGSSRCLIAVAVHQWGA